MEAPTVDICLKGVFYASMRTYTKGKSDSYYEYKQLKRDRSLTGTALQETALNFVHSVIEILRILLGDGSSGDENVDALFSRLTLEPVNVGVILNFMKSIVSAKHMPDFPNSEGLEMDIRKAADNLRKETSEIWAKHWPAFDKDVRKELKLLIIRFRVLSQTLPTEPDRRVRSAGINKLLTETLDLNLFVGEQSLILRMGLLVLELAFLGTIQDPSEHHIKLYILNQLQRVIYSIKQNRTFVIQTAIKLNKVNTKAKSRNISNVSPDRTDAQLFDDPAIQNNKVIQTILGPLKKLLVTQKHDLIPRVYQTFFNPNVNQQMDRVRTELDMDPLSICYILTGQCPSHVIRFKYYCIQHLKALRMAYAPPNIDSNEIKQFYSLFPKLYDKIVFPDYNEAMSPLNPNNFENFEESQLIHALRALRKMIEFAQSSLKDKDAYVSGMFDHLNNLINSGGNKKDQGE